MPNAATIEPGRATSAKPLLGETEVRIANPAASATNPDGLTPEEFTRLDTIWRDGTERSHLSTASNIVTVEDTGHAIQLDHPTVVISELLKLLPQPTSAHELAPTGREIKP